MGLGHAATPAPLETSPKENTVGRGAAEAPKKLPAPAGALPAANAPTPTADTIGVRLWVRVMHSGSSVEAVVSRLSSSVINYKL